MRASGLVRTVITLACRRRSRLSAPADQWKGSGGTGRFPQQASNPEANRSRSFAYFPSYVLAFVADALALVGLGRAHFAHLRRDLADLLLVDPLDENGGRVRHFESDPLRRLDHDRMRKADIQLQIRATQGGPVADALDLEPLLEPAGDTLDHVRDQGARQPVEGAIVAALSRPLDDQRAIVLLDLHPCRNVLAQLPERSIHLNAPRANRHVHPTWKFDWLFSDSAHLVLPLVKIRSIFTR